jgi:hypothetical protein
MHVSMRRVLVLAVFAACRSKAPAEERAAPPSGSAPHATPAPIDAGAFCVIPDKVLGNTPSAFIADDTTATLCLDLRERHYCGAVDLATGVWRTASASPSQPAFTDKVTDDKQLICPRGGACVTLQLPVDDFAPQLAISASGATLAAYKPGAAERGYQLFDAKTGAVTKTLHISGECHGAPHFAGESLFVITSDCSGAPGIARLYTSTGEELGTIEGVDDVAPAHVRGTHYAIRALETHGYILFDSATGKVVEKHPLDEIKADTGYVRIDDDLPITMTAVTPKGKLVILGNAIRLVDLATGAAEKVIPFPMCAGVPKD